MMKTINISWNKYKSAIQCAMGGLCICLAAIACAPVEDDSHELGGSQVALPQDWQVTATDNDNEIVIDFDPLTIIDGANVLAVQFTCIEAGINFVVKNAETTTFSKKVFRGGDYMLYVAAVTRAGTGMPREVPFTVVKNLVLETLSLDVLKEQVQMHVSHSDWATGHDETVFQGEFYIEKNSEITLGGELANDDVVLNLDFFNRVNTSTAQFLGESDVYAVYYNPVRKFVILSVPEPMIPNYLTLVGVGMGYPTTVSTEAIKAVYGDGSDGRGHTYWNYDNALSYILFRKVGENVFQGTMCFEGTNNGFKPYVNNEGGNYTPWYTGSYGSDGIKYVEITGGWTGSLALESSDGNDWHTVSDIDPYQFYRITLDIANKSVNIKKVTTAGEVLPDDDEPVTPTEPDGPVQSDNFDMVTAKLEDIDGEMFHTILHSLEKEAEYTLKGSLADASIVYNVDFFERIANNKVKFLGETGDYTLYYNPIRKFMIIGTEEPAYPDYLQATGDGLGYPTKMASNVIGAIYAGKSWYTTAWTDNMNVLKNILFRKISEDIFQATVYVSPDAGFKPFDFVRGGWGFGSEYNTEDMSFSGERIIAVGPASDNWKATADLQIDQPYRITIDVQNKTVDISKFDLP
jgi:hypothetical protein